LIIGLTLVSAYRATLTAASLSISLTLPFLAGSGQIRLLLGRGLERTNRRER
jgi:hypothetical protein